MRRLLLLFILFPHMASAAAVLTWQFPRDVVVDAFQVTLTDLVAQQADQLKVAPSTAGACGDPNPNLFCAQLPACPPPGVYGLFVQAIIGDEITEEQDATQNGIVCHITVTAPCQCVDLPASQPPDAQTIPQPLPASIPLPPPTTSLASTITPSMPTFPALPPPAPST